MSDAVFTQFLKIPIDSWNMFTTILNSLEHNTDVCQLGFCYRGQSDAAWSLRPSFDRFFAGTTLPPERAAEIEVAALKEFKAKAYQFADMRDLENISDITDWWALMQHFGAPTRLLDWTHSAYVAAYFAACQHPERPGSVWFIAPDELAKENVNTVGDCGKTIRSLPHAELNRSDSPEVVAFAHQSHLSSRMIAQQGLFSICRKPLVDHNIPVQKLFGPISKSKGTLPNGRFIIPAELKPVFLHRLRAMNITASALFPGLDGLGRSVSEFVNIASIFPRAKAKVDDFPILKFSFDTPPLD